MHPKLKRFAVWTGTFSVALGIGFVMQNGDVLAARFGAEDELRAAQERAIAMERIQQPVLFGTAAQVSLAPASGISIAPTLESPINVAYDAPLAPSEMMGPQRPGTPVQLVAIADDAMPSLDGPQQARDCTPVMSGSAGPAALVNLSLNAPCHGDTELIIHHQGMMISALTNEFGDADLVVPALAPISVFIADFDDGQVAIYTTPVPDFADYDRSILQWEGDAGLQIHALEFGADYGDAGHVWQASANEIGPAMHGQSGFVVRLGHEAVDGGHFAEIYSFPRGTSERSGVVQISAEVEVNDFNCGRDLSAQSIQILGSQAPQSTDLTLPMPGCDAVGDILILENVFEDLEIAALR